jgi:hypothetical protein
MYERNILVARHDPGKKPDAYIIDMPKAILFPYDISGTKMAWIDLYFLTASVIKHTGADGCAALLKRYGLNEDVARMFMAHVESYRPSKLVRNFFRAECEVWEFLAHFGVRCYSSGHLRR